MADASYQPKVYRKQGGDEMIVASGGSLDIESGGALKVAGVDITAVAGAGVAGVAAGYKVARGVTALDGANPTPVVTGLTTIVSFVASLVGSAAPGLGTSVLTSTISSGTASVYAWKVTSAIDSTLIASAGTESFSWIAVGV